MTKEEYAANIREAVQDAAREAFEQGCLNNSQVQIVLANNVTTQQFKTVLQSMHDTTVVKAPGTQLASSPGLLTAVAEQQVLLAQKQKYLWDQLTPIEHESIVGRVRLSTPEELPASKQRNSSTEKCVDLLHVDQAEKYQVCYNHCRGGGELLVGLDYDDEEVQLAQGVGHCRCGREPRYAFVVENYRYLQEIDTSPDRDYFKIWDDCRRRIVYDASKAGHRQYINNRIRISRPRCSGEWFYMIIYDANPRLLRVKLREFEEEVIIPEAANFKDFPCDFRKID